MKLYRREEIQKKIVEYQALLSREKNLQEELLSLNLHGDAETVKRNLKRHNEIIAEIREIRMNQVMPIMREMAQFIKECRRIEKERADSGGKGSP
ncbi:MAG: hypothetical protein RDV48_23585 [Candidatus Eremiobacteraeota bacterium]|nr:hypothetical protein [Candidatus Eremiobacteraeota bacterium]